MRSWFWTLWRRMMFLEEFICVSNCKWMCGCYLNVDEFEQNGFDVFELGLHVFFNYNNQNVSKQTARFISGSCRMFLRWVLMFFEFLEKMLSGMEMYVNGFGDEFTCREFIFYSCEFTEWRHSVCVVPLPFLKTETAKQGQAQHCKLHELHVTLLFVFPVWKRDPSAVSEFGLVLSGFS